MCILIEPQTVIHLHQATTLTPGQFIAGLTNFGPGRSKLFPNSTDEYLKVHRRGRFEADVTEGSGGIWERLHYDWSDPRSVVLTTTDSNVWGGLSGHTYTFTRRPDGTTDIEVVIVRDGKNLKGRVLGFVLGVIGRRVLGRAFEKSVKAIEARIASAHPGNENETFVRTLLFAAQQNDEEDEHGAPRGGPRLSGVPLLPVPVDAQPPDLRFQRLAGYSEFRGRPGRSGYPPMGLGKGSFDHFHFTIVQSRKTSFRR